MEQQYQAIVITPVKNAIENTLATIQKIAASSIPVLHIVYNDYSEEETYTQLEAHKAQYGYELIHLADITDTPSPNYKIVLQDAQRKALAADLPLIIVESDVEVKKDSLAKLIAFTEEHPHAGLVGAVTVDYNDQVNFPYLKFKETKETYISTNRSLSFCCTLLSIPFLKSYSFMELDSSKDWFDTSISAQAISNSFKNYVLFDIRVLHKPHGSRPWKQLKYSNPLKYYWLKFTKGRDKI